MDNCQKFNYIISRISSSYIIFYTNKQNSSLCFNDLKKRCEL